MNVEEGLRELERDVKASDLFRICGLCGRGVPITIKGGVELCARCNSRFSEREVVKIVRAGE